MLTNGASYFVDPPPTILSIFMSKLSAQKCVNTVLLGVTGTGGSNVVSVDASKEDSA